MDDLASVQQRKMFFALSSELGFDPEESKRRAKKHFNLESFKDITKNQLTELIDKLLTVQEERGIKNG